MTGDPGLRLARDGAVAELVLARPLRQNALSQLRCGGCSRSIAGRSHAIRPSASSSSVARHRRSRRGQTSPSSPRSSPTRRPRTTTTRLCRTPSRPWQGAPAADHRPDHRQLHRRRLRPGGGLRPRFAAADARLGIMPARLGLAYSLGEIKRLIELVGAARAKDLLFSARLLASRRGLADRLLDHVVATGELEATVRDYVRRPAGAVGQLAAADQAPDAADPGRRHGRRPRRAGRCGTVR